jgi:hypothetical protein
MIRKSVWPIIAGFLLLAALSVSADILLRSLLPRTFGPSVAPQGAIASVFTIFYAGGFGVLSSYLTARLAGSRPVIHALALGGIVFLLALGGLVGSWQRAPAWFNLGFLGVIFPSAWLGGFLRMRQLEV